MIDLVTLTCKKNPQFQRGHVKLWDVSKATGSNWNVDFSSSILMPVFAKVLKQLPLEGNNESKKLPSTTNGKVF